MKQQSVFRSGKRYPYLWRLCLIFIGVILISVGIFYGITALTNSLSLGPAQVNILELWKNGNYDEIIANSQIELKGKPLSSEALVFAGFAYFHKGIAEVSVEKKVPLINQSVIALRKALLLNSLPLRAEVYYVLGKAYFHKGKYYSDLAILNLIKAEDLGYTASDINEYLGLSYSSLGKYQKGSEYFLKAVEKSPSDILLWTLGQTFYQMNSMDKAVKYLRQSLEKTKDRTLEQKCHFLLGDIFQKTKQYDLATSEYQQILEMNPNSADAHYYLGEIQLALGNKEQARSEWRKAFKIDPLHFNANQRLFN